MEKKGPLYQAPSGGVGSNIFVLRGPRSGPSRYESESGKKKLAGQALRPTEEPRLPPLSSLVSGPISATCGGRGRVSIV